MWKAAAAAALVAVAVLAIAGCGSSSDATGEGNTGSTESDAPITKAALIKKGDAICRKTDDAQQSQLTAYEKANPGAIDKGGIKVAVVNAALPPISTEIEELAALGAPKGDEAEIAAIIKGFEKALRIAERKPQSVMGFSDGPFIAPDKLAAKYGFKDCAEAL